MKEQRGEKEWRSNFADRDLVEMNERNGARLQLPASCSLSSYIVLLFEGCRRRGEARRGREPAGKVGEKRRWKRAKPARRSGFGLGCSGVALPCGDHKGSRRILILLSPNLLTYLTYPSSSRRIHPAPWDNSIPSSLLSNATTSDPLICLSLLLLLLLLFFLFSPPTRSTFSLLPLLPVFSGAALR